MFSIITITHNRRHLLEKAIRSVLQQSHGMLEHLIVDDGSTDGTADMVMGISDRRLRYIPCPRSGRLSALRNKGLAEAKGDKVVFLDSDDLFEPGYLQRLHELYADPKLDFVISNAMVVSRQEEHVLFHEHQMPGMDQNLLAARLDNRLVIYPSCFSFRSETPIRFNEELKYGDSDLFQRLLAQKRGLISAAPLVCITKHSGNMSEQLGENPAFLQSYNEEAHTLKYLKEQGYISGWRYARTQSVYLYKQGREWQRAGRRQQARKCYGRSFRVFPLHLKAFIRFVFPGS